MKRGMEWRTEDLLEECRFSCSGRTGAVCVCKGEQKGTKLDLHMYESETEREESVGKVYRVRV